MLPRARQSFLCSLLLLFLSVAGFSQSLGKVFVRSMFGGQIFRI